MRAPALASRRFRGGQAVREAAPEATERGLRYARLVAWATVAVVAVLALFLALDIPLHAFDALSYGEWSRLIAAHWHLRFPSITDQTYHRPFYYVLQGLFWGAVGFDERAARILSGLFSALLIVSLVLIVRRRPAGGTAAALVAVLVVAVPDFARQVVAGLTDVPVAAMLALTGALVWRHAGGSGRSLAVGVAAAATALTKPTAFLALAALALAQLVAPRVELRPRLVMRVAPIAAGALLALVYDLVQARYLHESLFRFLTAGTTSGYYAEQARLARRSGDMSFAWFGDELRIVLLLALLYALVRVAGVAHRAAVLAAVPTALVLSWLGPWIGNRERSFDAGSLNAPHLALYAVLLALVFLAAVRAPADVVPPRLELARLLVWGIPPLVSWLVYAPFDTRLLSAAWPPFLALMAISLLPGVVALGIMHPAARLAPVGAAVVLALIVSQNAYNLDDLGHDGWKNLRAMPSSRWFDLRASREMVLPAFSRAYETARRQLGPHGRLFTSEGRFRFYLPGRVTQGYPRACADLRGYRAFVLLTDAGSQDYMRTVVHASPDPAFWADCTAPPLRQLSDGSEGYAVYRVGR